MLLALLLTVACGWWYRGPLLKFRDERLAVIHRARAQQRALASNPAPGSVITTWPYDHHTAWAPQGFISQPEIWIGPMPNPLATFRCVTDDGTVRVVRIARVQGRNHLLQVSAEPEYGLVDAPIDPRAFFGFRPAPVEVRIVGDWALGDTELLAPEAVPGKPDTIRLRFRQKDFESAAEIKLTQIDFEPSCQDGYITRGLKLGEKVVVLPSPLRKLHDASAFVERMEGWQSWNDEDDDYPPPPLARSLAMNDRHLLAFDGKTVYRRPREGGAWEKQSTIANPNARFTSNGKWLTHCQRTYDAATGAERFAPVAWRFGDRRAHHSDTFWVWHDEIGGAIDPGDTELYIPAYARDLRGLTSYQVRPRTYFEWALERGVGGGDRTEVTTFKHWAGPNRIAVSPDEQWLAIVHSSVWIDLVNLRTKDVQTVRMPSEPVNGDVQPFWSPDGRWLLLEGDEGIGGGLQRIAMLVDPERPTDFWVFPMPRAGLDSVFAFAEDSSCLLVAYAQQIAQLDLVALRSAADRQATHR